MTTILVVDDDPGLVRALSINLRARHFDVETAARRDDRARDGRPRSRPTSSILDLGLPDIDGVDVVARPARAGRAVPIIVLSARDSQSAKVDALDAGADDYVTKPFGMDELLARDPRGPAPGDARVAPPR